MPPSAALLCAALVLTGRDGLAQRVAVARWDERDGLQQSQVQGLASDAGGFLWVATKNGGLSRFDGTLFRSVGADEGLSERIVGPLAVSPDGSLWVGGAGLFVRQADRFHRILSRQVDALALTPSGSLLVGGPAGLSRVFRIGAEIRHGELLPHPVSALAVAPGSILAGGPDGLYSLLEEPTGARARGLSTDPVLALLPLAGGALVGGPRGLHRLTETGRLAPVLAEAIAVRVNALGADERGRVWLGTDAGAFRLSGDLSRVELSPGDGLPAVRILTLCVAPGGAVWMGGDGGGLYRYVPSRFAVVGREAGLEELLALSLADAPDGSLWIGTPRGELARLSNGVFTRFDPASGLPLTDRFRDLRFLGDGTLLASFDGGLVRKLPGSQRFEVLPAPNGVRPSGLALGPEDSVWLSTSSGLYRLADSRLQPVPVASLDRRPLDALTFAGERLLVSLEGRVVSVSGRGQVHELASAAGGLRGAPIWQLAVAADGAIWAASIHGALRIEGGDVRVLAAATGLPDDSVDAVLPAGDGTVWLSTDRGLAHLSREGRVLRAYGLADGLPAREGIVRGAHRDRSGRLWFGMVGALVVHDPSAEAYEPPPPRLHVERVRLPDRRRGERETQVDVTLIDFADSRGSGLSYRLDPLERAFSPPLSTSTIRWVDLPPGDYLFVARAVDRSGRPGPEVRAPVRIPRLWHETRLARGSLLLLALALGAALPAALRAGSRGVARAQAELSFLLRDVLAPDYVPIRGDPFSARELPLGPSRRALVDSLVQAIDRAWNRQEILALVGPPGAGKGAILAELARRRDTLWIHEVEEPAAALARLRSRLPGLPLLPRPADVAARLAPSGGTLLLLQHDRGPWTPEAARQRLALANELLGTAPGISLVAARDVEPSELAAEEPQLASLARVVRVPALSPEEAGAFLETVGGELARWAPQAAERAAVRVGGYPDRLRAFGSALLAHLGIRQTNRVREADVDDVLSAWEESPPPFLGALWARRSPSERTVLAGLGAVDRGIGLLRPLALVEEALEGSGFALGRVTIGAVVDRLCESETLMRQGDRVAFRDEVVGRFVARHRPLSEEKPSGAEVIGPWELLEPVGTGGMGTIYRARRLDDRSEAAVKVIHPHLLDTPEMRRRFLREGEIGARFSHPGVVRIFERGEAGGRSYIAMEYLPGRTLREVLQRLGPLPISLSVRLGRDLARAAAALHAAGILHRDIKSANVVLLPDWRLKLLDFGLARSETATHVTETGHVAGTPDSMAPEQVRGEEPSFSADVWAVGICLYEMLTAHSPFNRFGTVATFKAILEEEPEPASALRPSVPPALDVIVRRALRKSASDRYPTADALADALEELLPALPRPATLPSLETLSRRRGAPADLPPADVPPTRVLEG